MIVSYEIVDVNFPGPDLGGRWAMAPNSEGKCDITGKNYSKNFRHLAPVPYHLHQALELSVDALSQLA